MPVETVLEPRPEKAYLPWHSEPKQSQRVITSMLRNRVCYPGVGRPAGRRL